MKNHRVLSLGLTQAKGPEPGGGHVLEEAPTLEGDHADEGLALEEGLTLGRASPWGGPHPGWPITYSIYYFTFTLLLKSKMREYSLTKAK